MLFLCCTSTDKYSSSPSGQSHSRVNADNSKTFRSHKLSDFKTDRVFQFPVSMLSQVNNYNVAFTGSKVPAQLKLTTT